MLLLSSYKAVVGKLNTSGQDLSIMTSVMRHAPCFSTKAALASLTQTQYFINGQSGITSIHMNSSSRGSKSVSRSREECVTAIYSYISVMSPFHRGHSSGMTYISLLAQKRQDLLRNGYEFLVNNVYKIYVSSSV